MHYYNYMYTIRKWKNKYIAYDDNGQVIIMSQNRKIVLHMAEQWKAKK